jgi:hypothetical protein
MKTGSLNKRISNLENQKALPAEVHLVWYGEKFDPNIPHFRLKWLDECRGGLE